MSSEEETKKLLRFREYLEQRILELEQEKHDIETAINEIDKLIVNTGFRTFAVAEPKEDESTGQDSSEDEEEFEVTNKDGIVLGTIRVEDKEVIFAPEERFSFTRDIPPFESFLVERVLENMKNTDQKRAANGELDPTEILEYEIKETEEGKIVSLIIRNYGGERRLREINSSIRWTFDKMFQKIGQA